MIKEIIIVIISEVICVFITHLSIIPNSDEIFSCDQYLWYDAQSICFLITLNLNKNSEKSAFNHYSRSTLSTWNQNKISLDWAILSSCKNFLAPIKHPLPLRQARFVRSFDSFLNKAVRQQSCLTKFLLESLHS